MDQRFAAFGAVLILMSFAIAGCSGSNRRLRSITVTPAVADGQNFPNAQLQFTATGTFDDGSTSSSLNVLWSIGNPFALSPIPAGVTLSSSGLAQCTGFIGKVSITATAPVDPSIAISSMTMSTPNVSGSAQLTCP